MLRRSRDTLGDSDSQGRLHRGRGVRERRRLGIGHQIRRRIGFHRIGSVQGMHVAEADRPARERGCGSGSVRHGMQSHRIGGSGRDGTHAARRQAPEGGGSGRGPERRDLHGRKDNGIVSGPGDAPDRRCRREARYRDERHRDGRGHLLVHPDRREGHDDRLQDDRARLQTRLSDG